MNQTNTLRLRYLTIISVLALAAACRKTDDTDSGSCDISESQLTSSVYTAPGGKPVVTEYNAGLFKNQQVRVETLGPDTLLEVLRDSTRRYHIFSNGDYIRCINAGQGANGLVDTSINYYAYDGEHRLIRFWSTNVRYSATMPRRGSSSDTIGYIWESDNLIKEVNLSDNNDVFGEYAYVPNSPGRNPGNVPEASSRWLFRKGSTVRLSKNYVRKSTVADYDPQFDSRGRLVLERSPWPWGGTVTTSYFYSCQ